MPRSSRAHRADVVMIGFVGGTGGAAMLMREMACTLLRRGIGTSIVVPGWATTRPFADDCRARGIDAEQTHWLEEREPRSRAYLDAARLALRFRAPVVHYHLCTNVMPGRYVRPAQLLGSRPAFATIQDPYDDPPAGSPAARRWAAAVPSLFDRVICVSKAGVERQLAYGVPADRLRLIYNGVDVERFANGRSDGVRELLRVPPSAPLIVFSARLAPQKRPLDAVQAFARIASEFPESHLVLVGDGPLREAVRQEADSAGLTPRVHLTGHRLDLERWLAAATVWLLPTESEAFSLGVVEAMAARCPIVTTVCAGNEEVLEHERNALLAAVGDVHGLAGAVARLLRDEPLRRRLGDEACRDAVPFSLDRMVDAYVEEYVSAGWRPGSPAAGTPARAADAGTGPVSVRGS